MPDAYPTFKLRLSPGQRTRWEHAAVHQGRTLAAWIKHICDKEVHRLGIDRVTSGNPMEAAMSLKDGIKDLVRTVRENEALRREREGQFVGHWTRIMNETLGPALREIAIGLRESGIPSSSTPVSPELLNMEAAGGGDGIELGVGPYERPPQYFLRFSCDAQEQNVKLTSSFADLQGAFTADEINRGDFKKAASEFVNRIALRYS